MWALTSLKYVRIHIYAQLVAPFPRIPFLAAFHIAPIVGGIAVMLFQVIFRGNHGFSPGLGGLIEEVSLFRLIVLINKDSDS